MSELPYRNPPGAAPQKARAQRGPQPAFERMEASLLACPKCRVAVPVRKRLLLVLPNGDKYEYVCTRCGATCGDTVEPPLRPF